MILLLQVNYLTLSPKKHQTHCCTSTGNPQIMTGKTATDVLLEKNEVGWHQNPNGNPNYATNVQKKQPIRKNILFDDFL